MARVALPCLCRWPAGPVATANTTPTFSADGHMTGPATRGCGWHFWCTAHGTRHPTRHQAGYPARHTARHTGHTARHTARYTARHCATRWATRRGMAHSAAERIGSQIAGSWWPQSSKLGDTCQLNFMHCGALPKPHGLEAVLDSLTTCTLGRAWCMRPFCCKGNFQEPGAPSGSNEVA